MDISQVTCLSIPVADQDRAKDFYVNTLGFRLVRELPVPMGENSRWIEVAPAEGKTALILENWIPNMKPGGVDGVMMETRNMDADVSALQQAGVTVEGPFDTPWGRQASIKDPDGNGIVLHVPGGE
jgi:catechol 2,3-dioxygenase-like lactoylglutathione lyase family enzyme